MWTPHNPNPAAHPTPYPIPTQCRYCGSAVHLVHNTAVYGAQWGMYPWMYRCSDPACDAHVGIHPDTNIPLGSLARRELRELRGIAKYYFAEMWKSGAKERGAAYAWLAKRLGIPRRDCHIAWFEIEQCLLVIHVLRKDFYAVEAEATGRPIRDMAVPRRVRDLADQVGLRSAALEHAEGELQ